MRKIDDKLLLQMVGEGHEQKAIAEHMGVSRAGICQRLATLRKRAIRPKILDELTPRQQRFVTEITVNGVSQTEACRRSFDCSDTSAPVMASQLMKEPKIQQSIAEVLATEGVTQKYLAKNIKRMIESPDDSISHRSTRTACELLDLFPASKVKNLNVNVEGFCPVDLSKYS